MAVLKKHWVPVLAPSMFKHEQLGESYVAETDSLNGRCITVNLMALTSDMKKQNTNVSFRIISVKDGKAKTRVTKVSMHTSTIKRLVRRGRNKIELSFTCTLKHGQTCRIKPVIVTKTLANNSKLTGLRAKAKEAVVALCAELGFETLVQDIISMKLQRYLRKELSTIYPVRSVDIKECSLLPKFAADEEHEVEESSYVIEQAEHED